MDPSHYSEKHCSKAFDIDMEKTNGTNGPIHPVVSTAVGEAEDIHPTQGLERGLKSRHAQMIALGGTIGTGLFVGSGQALAMGGPLILLLSYIAISVFLYGVATGLTEIAAYLPVAGCSVATMPIDM
ncbi:hypothetical protein PRZ48_005097 [Zasmidium cellare]|uniref:Amino acid permease/ SLC12A domain-containing protein n=1 Tax=Zasmidium cellare TaxID=395010 RepID=A0ABR0ERG0_ZASCE|nr:hypothetical protein PRZ48_005097 [Zasmidium cellare]